MSPYADGQDDLARDIYAILISEQSDAAKLAHIRTLVEDCLPSPVPDPPVDSLSQLDSWLDTGTGAGYEKGKPYDPRD